MKKFIYILLIALTTINFINLSSAEFSTFQDLEEKYFSRLEKQIKDIKDIVDNGSLAKEDDWVYIDDNELLFNKFKEEIKLQNKKDKLDNLRLTIKEYFSKLNNIFNEISLLYSIQTNPDCLTETYKDNLQKLGIKSDEVYKFLDFEKIYEFLGFKIRYIKFFGYEKNFFDPKAVTLEEARKKIELLKKENENNEEIWRQLEYIFRNELTKNLYDSWLMNRLSIFIKGRSIQKEYDDIQNYRLELADLEGAVARRIKSL